MSESVLADKCPSPLKAMLAPEMPSQGGSPRTGISQATREYMDEKRASIDDLFWGGTGTKEGQISGGTWGNVGCKDLRGAGM
jgi:hypothetical protein